VGRVVVVVLGRVVDVDVVGQTVVGGCSGHGPMRGRHCRT
jgi:hypothetical protein